MSEKRFELSKDKIISLTEKYDDCTIEEIFENHETMGNCCVIIGNLKMRKTKYNVWFEGGIFNLTEELNKSENIKNLKCKLISKEDGFYEYVSFEW